jgi:hypothetical protein
VRIEREIERTEEEVRLVSRSCEAGCGLAFPLSTVRLFAGARDYFVLVDHQITTYVRFEVFTAVTTKNVVFWDIETQFVLYRRYVSATESSRLMLCKISGFHGGDYEKYRLLGYKTHFVPHRRHITSPLHTSAD